MAIFITSLKFTNEFRNETTSWLLGNIGDKITAEIDLTVQTTSFGDATFRPQTGYVGDNWIIGRNPMFKDFGVGDTIYITSTIPTVIAGPYTIIQKLSDLEIQVNTAPSSITNQGPGYSSFYNTTPITGIKYFNNLIENDSGVNYLSLTDGSTQLYINKDADPNNLTPVAMVAQGSKCWQIGIATIQGVGALGFAPFSQYFKIVHSFYITPFILADQWNDTVNGVAPTYLKDGGSLKYVTRIEAMYNYNDPNRFQFIEQGNVLGNTGWFNENFNGNPSHYSLSGFVYKNAALTPIEAIELSDNITDIEFYIDNVIDAPFSNLNTKFAINFTIAPSEVEEYTGNGNKLDDNFLFDRGLNTVGAAMVNGDQYGTNRQVLTNIAATYINATRIKVTANVSMNANVIDRVNGLEEKRYILFVAVQNHTIETKDADKVTLLIDATPFFENFSDPLLSDIENAFIRHTTDDFVDDGTDDIDVFPEDEIVVRSEFYIEKGHLLPTDTISIMRGDAIIKAKNSVTGESFDLSRFTYDYSELPVIDGAQYVDTLIDRNFHIPEAEPRRKIKIKRRLDIDTPTRKYYNVDFPFLFGWEYWQALKGVNDDFFNAVEQHNGFNNFWTQYASGDWKIYYTHTLKINKNGVTLTYNKESEIIPHDYNSNPDYTPKGIKSYNHATNVQLYDAGSGKNYILGYKDTRIESKFTKVTGVPNVNNYAMCIGIEAFESGGTLGRRRFSSVWPTESDTWYKSIDSSAKVMLSVVGQDIIGNLLIDTDQIPKTTQRYKITARLYDLTVSNQGGKITEDSIFKSTEDGIFIKDLE